MIPSVFPIRFVLNALADPARMYGPPQSEVLEGWILVSDTASPEHEEMPKHIMQGYTVMAREGSGPGPRGSLETSMECLACRFPSSLAWEILREGADAFLSIPDYAANETVALLRSGEYDGRPILTQPSGAPGLAGVMAAAFEPSLAEPLGLDRKSRVLVFGSEGSV